MSFRKTSLNFPSTLIAFCIVIFCFGMPLKADEIVLGRRGGVHTIPVTINGVLTLDFILDSGASDVQIPADVMLTLLRTGTVSADDMLGSAEYRLADGSTLTGLRLVIRSLRVGRHILDNVIAGVGPSSGALLLGQSFLSRMPHWSIDNRRGVLLLDEGRGLKAVNSSHNPKEVQSPTGETSRAQPSFECTKALSPVERLLCRDRALADMDGEMARLYRERLSELPLSARVGFRQEQREWLAKREACARTAEMWHCVTALYERRLTDLSSRP